MLGKRSHLQVPNFGTSMRRSHATRLLQAEDLRRASHKPLYRVLGPMCTSRLASRIPPSQLCGPRARQAGSQAIGWMTPSWESGAVSRKYAAAGVPEGRKRVCPQSATRSPRPSPHRRRRDCPASSTSPALRICIRPPAELLRCAPLDDCTRGRLLEGRGKAARCTPHSVHPRPSNPSYCNLRPRQAPSPCERPHGICSQQTRSLQAG